MNPRNMAVFQGIYMDAWWDKTAAAAKLALREGQSQPSSPFPLTVVAVDAPSVTNAQSHCHEAIQQFAIKALVAFDAKRRTSTSAIYTGMLGGGGVPEQ